MPKFHEAKLIAEGKRFALVVSRFNDFITEKLLSVRWMRWFAVVPMKKILRW